MTQKTNKIIAYVEIWGGIWGGKYTRGLVLRAYGSCVRAMLEELGPELGEWPIPGVPPKSHVIAVWEGTYTAEGVGEWRLPTQDELISLTI